MIGPATRDDILAALERFDREQRTSEDWQGWEQRRNYAWAIEHDGRRYPVKQIVSLATGTPTDSFRGGREGNAFVEERGFNVVRLAGSNEEEQDMPAPPSMVERLAQARAHVQPPMRAWIFQANPQLFDLDGALAQLSSLHWLVNQHAQQIHAGDIVYIWESGSNAGIVAVARVEAEPAMLPDDEGSHRFYREEMPQKGQMALRVPLRIERVLEERLTSDELRADPLLSNMQIRRSPQGTNFPLTPEEAARVAELVEERAKEEISSLDEDASTARDRYIVESVDEWRRAVITDNPLIQRAADEIPDWLAQRYGNTIRTRLSTQPGRPWLYITVGERWVAGFVLNRARTIYVWLWRLRESWRDELRSALSNPNSLRPGDLLGSDTGWRFTIRTESDYVLARHVVAATIDHLLGRLWPQRFDYPTFVVTHSKDDEWQRYGESYSFTNYAGGAHSQLSGAVEAAENGGPPVQLILYRPGPSYAITGWAKVVGVERSVGAQKDETRWTLQLEHHEFPVALDLKGNAAFQMKHLEWLNQGLKKAFWNISIRSLPPGDVQTIIRAAQQLAGEEMPPADAAHAVLSQADQPLPLAEIHQRAQARGWLAAGTTQMALASAMRGDGRFRDLGEGRWNLVATPPPPPPDTSIWRIHVPFELWPEAQAAGAIGIGWPIEETKNQSVKRFARVKPGDRIVAYVQQGRIGEVGVVTSDPVDVRIDGPSGFPARLFGGEYPRRLHVQWGGALAEPVSVLDDLQAIGETKLRNRLTNPNTVIELPLEDYVTLLQVLGLEDPHPESSVRLPDAWPTLAAFRDFARSLAAGPYEAATLLEAAQRFPEKAEPGTDGEALLEQLRQFRLLLPTEEGSGYQPAPYVAGDAEALLRLMALALLLPRMESEDEYVLPARTLLAQLEGQVDAAPPGPPRLSEEEIAGLLGWYAEAGLAIEENGAWRLAEGALEPQPGDDAASQALNRFVETLQAERAGTLASDLPPIGEGPLQSVSDLDVRLAELGEMLILDDAIVRRVLRSLLAGRNVVLSGPPGTGKTELARLLPSLFWREAEQELTRLSTDPDEEPVIQSRVQRHGYRAEVVTATEDWGVRDVVGGIGPRLDGEESALRFALQHGHLTRVLLQNYEGTDEGRTLPPPEARLRRREVRDGERRYRGSWLVIDEFTRAPVDAAFGSLLTTLSGGESAHLAVPDTDGRERLVPMPRDFRILGTLNSFDRHFLNQMSEAMKRRFDFIDVPPPRPGQATAERGITAWSALSRLAAQGFTEVTAEGDPAQPTALHLAEALTVRREGTGYGLDAEDEGAQQALDSFWRIFEAIRLFRQLGPAQAGAVYTNLFAGRLLGMDWDDALDTALADTLADQLQVLSRDEQALLVAYVQHAGKGTLLETIKERLDAMPGGRKAHLAHTLRAAKEWGFAGDEIKPEATDTLTSATVASYLQSDTPLALPTPSLFVRRVQALLGERGL